MHVISHWIYMQDDKVCPWYLTMRLFRQKTPDDWESVFLENYMTYFYNNWNLPRIANGSPHSTKLSLDLQLTSVIYTENVFYQ